MSGGEWMVVLVVAMLVIGRLVSRHMGYPGWGSPRRVTGGEERLSGEVQALKDRLVVLERIVTDEGAMLDHRIERLRAEPTK